MATSRCSCSCNASVSYSIRRYASTEVSAARPARPDPVKRYQPFLYGDKGWQAPLWWQRSTLALSHDQRQAKVTAKREARERHSALLAHRRDKKLRTLIETYHASHTFPSGSREDVLAAIDAEFLDRTPDRSPLPLSIDTILRESYEAGKDDDARGEMTASKTGGRSRLFDELDARRLAGDERAKDTVGSFTAHYGDGLQGRRSMARAAKIYDALHGTSGLGQAGLETARERKSRSKKVEAQAQVEERLANFKLDFTNQKASGRGRSKSLKPDPQSL